MTDQGIAIAVFNTSEDTTDMLRELFQHAGFVAVTAFTHDLRDNKVDLESLMRQYRPAVIVYDIALPYEANWQLCQRIRSSPVCKGVPFVLTTTNVAQVRKVAGPEPLIEIVGKPYDLELLLQSVERAATVRSAANHD